eukprot:EG_transcript_3501
MGGTHSVVVLLLAAHLPLVAGTSHLGYCSDGASSDCRWRDYLQDVLLQGLFGWVIAALVLILFVVYLCVLCAYCCQECCCSAPTRKRAGQSVYLYYVVRVLAWIAVLATAAGLGVAIAGWFRIDDVWNSGWNGITAFTTSLATLMQTFQGQLQTAEQKLLNSAATLSMPSLGTVISSSTISSSMKFSTDVNQFIKDVKDIADLAYLAYRWGIIGLFAIVTAVAIIFALLTFCYKALRCCSCWLILLGLVVTFVMWLSVGLAVVGHRLLTDTCTDLAESLGDSTKGTGLLSQLKCDRNNNTFSAVYNVYNTGVASLNQSFCSAVASKCRVNGAPVLSSCECRSDGDTERFVNETLVFSDTQCIGACSVAACATRCAHPTPFNVSSGLTDLSAARAMLQAGQPQAQAVQTCQYFVDGLFRPEEALCGTLKTGLWLLIAGQIALAAGGLLCAICLIIVECWLRSYTPEVVPYDGPQKGHVVNVRY